METVLTGCKFSRIGDIVLLLHLNAFPSKRLFCRLKATETENFQTIV